VPFLCGTEGMRAKLTLRPGQRGTKKLVRKYGDRLVCVRYRYDGERRKRYKTVELIIEESDWEPKAAHLPDYIRFRVNGSHPAHEADAAGAAAGGDELTFSVGRCRG
jgi:hypothetical protein